MASTAPQRGEARAAPPTISAEGYPVCRMNSTPSSRPRSARQAIFSGRYSTMATMRVTSKFALVVTAWIATLLAAQGALHFARLSALNEQETRDDIDLLTRTLGTATAEVWKLDGPAGAQSFVRRVAQQHPRKKLQLLPTASAGTATVVGSSAAETAVWPVKLGDESVATLAVSWERPDAQLSSSHSLLLRELGLVLLAAVLSASVVVLLGVWLVGDPLNRRTAVSRRLPYGVFRRRRTLALRDHGEMEQLARELEVATQQLAECRATVESERRTRTSAFQQLRQADRLSTVGKLASSVAHELGTPLNVAAGRATMIANDSQTGASSRRNAEIIIQQTRRIAEVVRRLLDHSRVEPLNLRRAMMSDVLRQAASLMAPVCDAKGVVLSIEARDHAEAELDTDKALQILTNLITNAVQAMPQGGTVTLSAERVHVDDPKDRRAVEGDFVRLDVCDQGQGIAKERLDDIFEAFFNNQQADAGTGLGLSVCHGIVREQGGFIEVESEVGQGSCFSVYLPEKEAA